jgi:hypothetical protein
MDPFKEFIRNKYAPGQEVKDEEPKRVVKHEVSSKIKPLPEESKEMHAERIRRQAQEGCQESRAEWFRLRGLAGDKPFSVSEPDEE